MQARDTLLQTFLKSAILKDCILSFHFTLRLKQSGLLFTNIHLLCLHLVLLKHKTCRVFHPPSHSPVLSQTNRASLLLCSNIMNTIVIQMICKFHDCLIFVTVQKIIQSIWNCQDMSVWTEVVNQRYSHRPPHVASSANAAILNF